MSRTRLLCPAMVALLMSAVIAVAQPSDEAEEVPPPTTESTQSSPGTSAPATGGTAGASSRAGRSPSDYQASEQISEDLPVSFPVDI